MAARKQLANLIGDSLRTLRETAELLRLNQRTVLEYTRRGVIKGSIIDRRWRFRLEDLYEAHRSAVLPVGREVRIKNRKVALRRIYVPMGHRGYRAIYVTNSQLAHLNRIPIGKELFLSNFYCLIGGGYRVVRTKKGLQYMPHPLGASRNEDISILEALLRD